MLYINKIKIIVASKVKFCYWFTFAKLNWCQGFSLCEK